MRDSASEMLSFEGDNGCTGACGAASEHDVFSWKKEFATLSALPRYFPLVLLTLLATTLHRAIHCRSKVIFHHSHDSIAFSCVPSSWLLAQLEVGNLQKPWKETYSRPCTACGHRMAHRKWKETDLPPDTDGPGNMLGCCLVSFHFLWAILCPQAVDSLSRSELGGGKMSVRYDVAPSYNPIHVPVQNYGR